TVAKMRCASCCRALARMAHLASGPSKNTAEWPWPRPLNRPSRVLAERKILQKAEIHVRQHRAPEGVSAEPQRPRGEREGTAAVGIDACQRVDRPTALDGENRRHLDMPEDPRDPGVLCG